MIVIIQCGQPYGIEKTLIFIHSSIASLLVYNPLINVAVNFILFLFLLFAIAASILIAFKDIIFCFCKRLKTANVFFCQILPRENGVRALGVN